SSADPAHLRAALAVTLPEYMLPSAVVVLDVLPLTPNGKVDRHALPAPDRAPVMTSAAAQPPVTDTERVVAGIWAEVLGIAHFDRNANFFDLGGHSLSAMKVTTRLCEKFGRDLAVLALFEHPTVATCAASIDRTPVLSREGAASDIAHVTRAPRRGNREEPRAGRIAS